MSNSYNKYYLEKNYFGEPYPGLVKFFAEYEDKCQVLDLGCGQGRDSLTLGRLGYNVLGVDISDVGINQLNETVKKENLSVKGIVSDIYEYPIAENIDIVLLDSMFHFYKKDIAKESGLLTRIARELRSGGVICNFMQQGEKRENHLKETVHGLGISFEVLCDEYTDYPKFDAKFHMYILRKE